MAQQSLPAATTAPPTIQAASRGSGRRLIVIGVVLLVVVAALLYWLRARHFEDTDDAQVDGSISNVSPRVSGSVNAVYVAENQPVKAGDVLAEIDPSDLQIAVAEANAQVAQAQAQLEGEDPGVPIVVASNRSALSSAQSDLAAAQAGLSAARKELDQITAQLAQAKANDQTAQLERQRAEKLIVQGAISQADYDLHVNGAMASAASLVALTESLAAAKDRVRQHQAQIVALQSRLVETTSNGPRQVATRQASVSYRQAALDLAKAQLAQAERNLSYAKVIAPVSGLVAKKAIAVGDHVAPGQQVVAISQIDSLWITANYRETQLEHIQPGQPATVHIDSLNLDLMGAVESIGGATGSRLSVLPPENASGNYVKVVQRIPVRIRINPGQTGTDRLRIGMSAGPRVTVR
ncbi:MAG: HlyD family secretion protein [Myxococcota bacterium]|nr:HlyD family secretion protein [Myxococcota bacterium]